MTDFDDFQFISSSGAGFNYGAEKVVFFEEGTTSATYGTYTFPVTDGLNILATTFFKTNTGMWVSDLTFDAFNQITGQYLSVGTKTFDNRIVATINTTYASEYRIIGIKR